MVWIVKDRHPNRYELVKTNNLTWYKLSRTDILTGMNWQRQTTSYGMNCQGLTNLNVKHRQTYHVWTIQDRQTDRFELSRNNNLTGYWLSRTENIIHKVWIVKVTDNLTRYELSLCMNIQGLATSGMINFQAKIKKKGWIGNDSIRLANLSSLKQLMRDRQKKVELW